MKKHLHKNESGNVIFIILIAVALLAALTFTISQGSQGTSQTVTKDRARLLASEIVGYSQTIANAVAQLRLRGCTETQISFENNAVTGYTNGSAPANNTCDIFNLSGGGINWQSLSSGTQDTGGSGEWKFTADHHITDIGSCGGSPECSELLAIVEDIDEEICIQINKLIGITNPSDIPPLITNGYTGGKFTGTYGDEEEYSSTEISGKKAGCFKLSLESSHYFYRVLIAR